MSSAKSTGAGSRGRADGHADVAGSKAAIALLLGAVAGAGVASLLYEVLWVRQLALSLGSTVYATSTMLSAFLGGLALGGWLSGRNADKLASPLRRLAGIEVAAALIGALAVPMLGFAGRAYLLMAAGLSSGSGLALLVRVLLSLVVMLLPATLFGMAFPLAVSAAARLTTPEWASASVYAASSFGSAVGAGLGGLYLEPTLGLSGSALVGAGINLAAGALAFLAFRAVSAAQE